MWTAQDLRRKSGARKVARISSWVERPGWRAWLWPLRPVLFLNLLLPLEIFPPGRGALVFVVGRWVKLNVRRLFAIIAFELDIFLTVIFGKQEFQLIVTLFFE